MSFRVIDRIKDERRNGISTLVSKELLKGYGSVLDISGGRQITFNPRRLSDADRLGGDWRRVGDDMRIWR